MKKGVLIHAEISRLIASLGHRQSIVIADSGLPVPRGVPKIDLALTQGVPDFARTLETVISELKVEEAWMADEIIEHNPAVYEQIRRILRDVPLKQVTHEQLKQQVGDAAAVIRTGECTPYANVLLVSGVVF
jgi:D-ribose pyranase